MSFKIHSDPETLIVGERTHVSNRLCASCGCVLGDYGQVGYDGPARNNRPTPENTDCSPFTEWATLCDSCAKREGAL